MSLQIFVGISLLPGNKFQFNYICFNDCSTIWKGPIIRFQGFSQFVVRYQLSALQLTTNLLNNNNFDSLIWFCKKYLISPKYPWKSLWKTINHNMHYAQNTFIFLFLSCSSSFIEFIENTSPIFAITLLWRLWNTLSFPEAGIKTVWPWPIKYICSLILRGNNTIKTLQVVQLR